MAKVIYSVITSLDGYGPTSCRSVSPLGLVDEFEVNVAPILLGGGARLLDKVGNLEVEQVPAIGLPGSRTSNTESSSRAILEEEA